MAQPAAYSPLYSYSSEMASTTGVHLDSEFASIAAIISAIESNLAIIQRDDTAISNQSIGANQFASDALALIAGQQSVSTRWVPRGFWLTATLYKVTDVIETGSPGVAYVCVTQHTSGVFATDHAAGKWVVLSAPRTIVSGDVTAALGYTPVNKAGDTMTGALIAPSGTTLLGASGIQFTDGFLATQDLAMINKGLFSNYISEKNNIIYGFASNVLRDGGAGVVVGGQFSGYATIGPDIIFGSNVNAIGLGAHLGAMVGMEVDVVCTNPSNGQAKIGVNPIFFNRTGTNPGSYTYTVGPNTYNNAGSGLGANLYNAASIAVWIQSQARSTTGEYCGWTRGIQFDEFSLDSQVDGGFPASRAYPIGINFSNLHYYGGADPVTGFNLEAAIAFRDLQGILWNRDPTNPGTQVNKIRTHFNPFTARWSITNAGSEVFGVDVTTGNLYKNGVISTPVTLGADNAFTGANSFAKAITFNGSGTNQRILGDLTNATITNRLQIQTTTLNSASYLGIIPNGSGGSAGLDLIAKSGSVDCNTAHIAVDNSQFTLQSAGLGTFTLVPITFFASGAENMRLNTSGQLLIATTSAPVTGGKLRVNGIVQIDNSVSFSVNNNAVNQTIANTTFTTVGFSTKEFDQNSNFDTGTSAFTPPAGKYLLSACVQYLAPVDQKRYATIIYKNGVALKNNNLLASGTEALGTSVTCVVDANGTDAFSVVTWHDSGGAKDISGATADTWFAGHRIG